MKFIQTKDDINMLKQDEIGAILTLEGCEAIGKRCNENTVVVSPRVRSLD